MGRIFDIFDALIDLAKGDVILAFSPPCEMTERRREQWLSLREGILHRLIEENEEEIHE